MNLRTVSCLCYALSAWMVAGRSGPQSCGTYPGNWQETLDHHEKAERRRAASGKAARAAGGVRRDADIGNVAVIENDDSIFGRRNPFNLDQRQLTFTPREGGYSYALTAGGIDQAAAGSGEPIAGLGDDDSQRRALPFAFRFYGVEYRELWVNSDGNVTFTEGDNASSARSLGRMAGGPPRISALFTDLDPSTGTGSVRVLASATEYTLTWLRVPEFVDFGVGRPQTFQMRLKPDGTIVFAWEGVNIADGVVGISPGETATRPLLASFLQTPMGAGSAMIAERFGDAQALDLVAAARRFYETHDDAYDYLAFFNANGVQPGTGVLAFESTVRSNRAGIGDMAIDVGRQYGSPRRLQAVLNMGPVSNFPANPNAPHPARSSTGDTGLTVLAHELGHLFLAFSSIRVPGNPAARPMLGRQLFHWNFRFNSEASILEGNRIQDNGPEASPRFLTTATVEGFSALDQYLMGLRAAGEVPPTFLVENASTTLTDPRVGVGFNGTRRDVAVEDLIAVDGPRIPSHEYEQRRYRVAMILIVPEGGTASAGDLALLEGYKTALEAAWGRYTGGRGAMEATLRREIRLSVEPAAGVIAGREFMLEASIGAPAAAAVAVAVRPLLGLVEGPETLTIPAGQRTASANYRAVRTGVETVRAEAGAEYMTVEARVRVAEVGALALQVVSGDRQLGTAGQALPNPIVVRLSDGNLLPYGNVRIVAAGSGVTPASAVTSADGTASFRWTPPADGPPVVRFSVEGSAAPFVEAIALGRPVFAANAVVNAASFRPGLTPGGIATIFGVSLGQPQVFVEGMRAQVFFAGDRQINFAVPNVATGMATVEVRTALGSAMAAVGVLAVQPGIFFDAGTGRAAAIDRGSRIFEVYGTGFGSAPGVTAMAGGRPAAVLFHGLAPGFTGLYQTNIQVDGAVAAGEQVVTLTASGVTSNEVKVVVAP